MTKLEELLKELCPNGVEYIELAEILNYEQPQKTQIIIIYIKHLF